MDAACACQILRAKNLLSWCSIVTLPGRSAAGIVFMALKNRRGTALFCSLVIMRFFFHKRIWTHPENGNPVTIHVVLENLSTLQIAVAERDQAVASFLTSRS